MSEGSLSARLADLDTEVSETDRAEVLARLRRGREAQSQGGRAPIGHHAEVTVKATRLCNLRCTYCGDWRSGPGQVMSDEVVEALTVKALAAHRSIRFGWHGGEPLVLPIAFYERALELQRRHRTPGQQITNGIQTNAVLMTDEWARFIATHEISVGVSIDGPRDIHDSVRRSRSGGPTFDAVLAGLERLRANDVPYGALVTVDRSMLAMEPGEVLDFLWSLRAEGVGFNAARPAHHAEPDPSATFIDQAQMNRFLIALDQEQNRRGRWLPVREIESVRARLRAATTISCQLAGDCVGTFFVVEPNGDIAHCARFLDDEAYTFGNIVRHDFDRIRRSVRLLERRREARSAAEDRQQCPSFEFCQGGCPHERVVSQRHAPHHDPGCCGRTELIDHLRRAETQRDGVEVAARLTRR